MTGHGNTDRSAGGTGATTDSGIDAATIGERDKPTVEQLEAAMLTLRPGDREIFLAHRLDGMSYRQMAEITGLPIRHVEKAMARAIGDLHCALRGESRRRRRWWWPF